MIQFRLILYY